MHTVLTRSPAEAASFLIEEEVVAFPTETVYGLGAHLFSNRALAKIFEAKERPADNPLIAHIADIRQIAQVAAYVPPHAAQLIMHFFPGPLTIVLPKHRDVPLLATAALETIGVRMPSHPTALAFLSSCGVPVAAPSANRSGRPSPTTWEAVAADLQGRVSCILQDEPSEIGLESTVVDCTAAHPAVLRAGAVTLESLREVVPETRLAEPEAAGIPLSPGRKHRHYAPRARVVVVGVPGEAIPSPGAAFIGLETPAEAGRFLMVERCADENAYAHNLFAFFRRADEAGAHHIYCLSVPEIGLGLALMDRIRRAALG